MIAAPAPVTYVDFPIRIREAEVVRVTNVTPLMLRVTFGGEGAVGFQSAIFDEHVKLIFPEPDTGELRVPVDDGEDGLIWPRPIPTSREYTVRAHRPMEAEFDIDFAIHPGGLASDWALAAQPGDRIHIAGPPGGYRVSDDYDFYIAVADHTALPALTRWFEEMPRSAVGAAVIAVPGPEAIQPLSAPEGFGVTWLFHGDAAPTQLAEAATAIEVPPGASAFAWLAGEAGSIKPLRRWVREVLGLTKDHSSITGYWKYGAADTHEHLDEDD